MPKKHVFFGYFFLLNPIYQRGKVCTDFWDTPYERCIFVSGAVHMVPTLKVQNHEFMEPLYPWHRYELALSVIHLSRTPTDGRTDVDCWWRWWVVMKDNGGWYARGGHTHHPSPSATTPSFAIIIEWSHKSGGRGRNFILDVYGFSVSTFKVFFSSILRLYPPKSVCCLDALLCFYPCPFLRQKKATF